MENAIRARRAHFSLLFCWKSDLGLSWRHLRGIMGRLGKKNWVVLAPKTPNLGPKTLPRWAQDPQENKTKIVVIRVPCSRAAQERPRALQGSPPNRWGTPPGVGFCFIFYWFLVRSGPPCHRYFDWVFPRVFQEQSWDEGFFLEHRGRDSRAFFRQNAVKFGDFWMTGHKSSAVAGTPRSGALDKKSKKHIEQM